MKLPLRFLALVYLVSLFVVALSAWQGINVQDLFRVPFIRLRWIDLAILIVAVNGIWAFWVHAVGGKVKSNGRVTGFQLLLIALLIFDFAQLVRTYGVMEPQAQLSLFAASLTLGILLYFSCVDISPAAHDFLLKFSLYGAVILVFIVIMQVIGLSAGFAVRGQEERVEFEVPGGKETVSNIVLIPLVILHGLIALRIRQAPVKALVYKVAIGALFLNVVMAIHRGLMAMWVAILLFFLPRAHGASLRASTKSVLATAAMVLLVLFLASDTLRGLGYDPVEKLTGTFESATDVEREHWDRGRGFSYAAAISVWLNHPWLGVGFDVLDNHVPVGMSPHNVFITSLFHRGVVGTILLVSVLFLCYTSSIRLWRRSREMPLREKLLNQALVFASWLWLIPLMTQEATLEKYSLSIQYMYFGIIMALNRYYERSHVAGSPG